GAGGREKDGGRGRKPPVAAVREEAKPAARKGDERHPPAPADEAEADEPRERPDEPGERPADPNVPTVVGVGASAGGLEAFSQLLGALPSQANIAVVFVQHLSPQHESALPTLLATRTPLPVVQ